MTDLPYDPDYAPYSARYAIVRGAEVHTWSEDEAVMDYELFNALRDDFGAPVVGYVGGLHYAFKPTTQVPGNAAAIPESKHGSQREPSALLIQK